MVQTRTRTRRNIKKPDFYTPEESVLEDDYTPEEYDSDIDSEICTDDENKIMKEVEEQLETNMYSELISIFLRTYIKERFIQWFCSATIRYGTEITIRKIKEI